MSNRSWWFALIGIVVCLVAFVSLAPAAGVAPGVSYVKAEPLAKVVKASVQPVKESPETTLFIITWGGDIATILANGGSLSTTSSSLFAEQGLRFKLVKEDNFPKQLERYMRGESPYLRGTISQIKAAAEVLESFPGAKPEVIYQLTWSAGGDVLVVKEGIKTAADLKGKTIAIQAYGPHVDFLIQILADAQLTLSDVTIKWTKDLTGSSETPAEALRTDSSVDAAFVITPDALALTSNGTVGTGAEQSVKGAYSMLSTRTANHTTADVYAVRADYRTAHSADVSKLVHVLLKAEEQLRRLMKDPAQNREVYNQIVASSAGILLDDPKATSDLVGLYGDCEYVGYQGNVLFFSNSTYSRGFPILSQEVDKGLLALGLVGKSVAITAAGLDYEALKSGLINVEAVTKPKFDAGEVAKVVGQRAEQGTLGDGELFSFEVLFKPNQASFDRETYKAPLGRVTKLASTYGGAIMAIEAHADPMAYLTAKKKGEGEAVLNKIRQGAKNLSLARGNAVRDSIIAEAAAAGVSLDPSQFTVIGHGISQPKTGVANGEPIAPANEKEWYSNMRVVFRLVNVETEASVFKPL